MEGEMKKALDFLKDPLSFPVLFLGLIYALRLSTAPMDSNFLIGLVIAAIYSSITFLARAASTNWKWSLLFIVFLSPVILGTAVFTYFVLGSTELTDWKQGKLIVITALLAAIIFSVIILLVKPEYKNRALSLLLFFSTVPVLGATAAYPLYFYPEKLQEAELGEYKYYQYFTKAENKVEVE